MPTSRLFTYKKRLWTPSALGSNNILLWIRADSPNWLLDLSGNNRNFSVVAGSFSTVNFNGRIGLQTTNGCARADITFPSSVTIEAYFLYYRLPTQNFQFAKLIGLSGVTNNFLWSFDAQPQVIYDNITSGTERFSNGTNFSNGSWTDPNGAQSDQYRLLDTSGTFPSGAQQIAITGRPDGSEIARVNFFEFLLRVRTNENDRHKVRTYMLNRAGLTSLLPNGSPYKARPPYLQ